MLYLYFHLTQQIYEWGTIISLTDGDVEAQDLSNVTKLAGGEARSNPTPTS